MMNLKKSVCKKCRTKEFHKKGWNEFAEAWFNGSTGDAHIHCPYTIFNRMAHRIKEKALATASPGQKQAIDIGAILIKYRGSSVYQSVKCSRPPHWCPYKKDHDS